MVENNDISYAVEINDSSFNRHVLGLQIRTVIKHIFSYVIFACSFVGTTIAVPSTRVSVTTATNLSFILKFVGFSSAHFLHSCCFLFVLKVIACSFAVACIS